MTAFMPNGTVLSPEAILEMYGDKNGPHGLFDANHDQLGWTAEGWQLTLLDAAYDLEGTYAIFYCSTCDKYDIVDTAPERLGWWPGWPCPKPHYS